MYKSTNLNYKGLVSVDRSNKATLPLTTPRNIFKSSAKDLSSPISKIAIRQLPRSYFHALGSYLIMIPDV